MRATHSRFAVPAVVAALAAMLAISATAAAEKTCSPSSGRLSPRLTSPCARATIKVGHNVTWTVADANPKAKADHPYLNLTKLKPKHGIVPDDRSGAGIFAELKSVKGHSGRFTYEARADDFAGYWLVTKGTWYVQVQQIDPTVKGGLRYSPVETIHVS
jgi:hypothetical protein